MPRPTKKTNLDLQLILAEHDVAQEKDDIRKLDKSGLISKIENRAVGEYLTKSCRFRFNSVLERVEYSNKINDPDYRLLSERDLNSLFHRLKKLDNKLTLASLKILLNSDFVEEVDPFDDYFKSLKKWDKKQDYIESLASHVKTSDQEFWNRALKKWLVAVVACALNPDVVNQQVLVLSGAQGIGKTTYLNALLPPKLRGYLYMGVVDPDNKDTLVNLSENLLINLDELENLNRSELGSLKSLISQSAIRIRKAYGIYNENLVRRASFMGSVNDAEFLLDTTGNRRFLCFAAQNIDLAAKFDIDSVYSQAYSLYLEGENGLPFKYWFSGDEIAEIESRNADYIRKSSEEELLLKYFSVPISADFELMTPVELLAYFEQREGIKTSDGQSIKKLGQALTKHGFKKKSIKNSKPYMVAQNKDAYSTKDRVADEEKRKYKKES